MTNYNQTFTKNITTRQRGGASQTLHNSKTDTAGHTSKMYHKFSNDHHFNRNKHVTWIWLRTWSSLCSWGETNGITQSGAKAKKQTERWKECTKLGWLTCSWRTSLRWEMRFALDVSTVVSCSTQSFNIECCPLSSSAIPDPLRWPKGQGRRLIKNVAWQITKYQRKSESNYNGTEEK